MPYFDRCVGKKASGEQCTRRKKDNYDLCGTHIKGTPHKRVGKLHIRYWKHVLAFHYFLLVSIDFDDYY